jgi:hypothetical protein
MASAISLTSLDIRRTMGLETTAGQWERRKGRQGRREGRRGVRKFGVHRDNWNSNSKLEGRTRDNYLITSILYDNLGANNFATT